jgi:hypothetical protein
LTGDPIANIKLLEDPGKNLVVIMKNGKVCKNTCDACRLPLAALSGPNPPRSRCQLMTPLSGSPPRDGSFAGLALDQDLKTRDAEPWCGWIRLEGGVTELFDVRVLPRVQRPTATGFLTDEIHRAFTIEVD